MNAKEIAKRTVDTSGFRPGGQPVKEPAKLNWRHTGSNEVFYCCHTIGVDADTKQPIFCGEVSEYMADTGPGRSTALCEKHFEEMGLSI